MNGLVIHQDQLRMINKRLLEGIKIIDMSRILAGPWATQLLADYGADVIKIEKPSKGDDTRHWGPPWLDRDNEESDAALSLIHI